MAFRSCSDGSCSDGFCSDGFLMALVALAFCSNGFFCWGVAMAPVVCRDGSCGCVAMALRAACNGFASVLWWLSRWGGFASGFASGFCNGCASRFGGYDGLKDAMALWLRSDGSLLRFWLLFALAPVAIVPVRWLL